jgi:hypothetical protein
MYRQSISILGNILREGVKKQPAKIQTADTKE